MRNTFETITPADVLIERLGSLRESYRFKHDRMAQMQSEIRRLDEAANELSKAITQTEKAIVALGGQVPAEPQENKSGVAIQALAEQGRAKVYGLGGPLSLNGTIDASVLNGNSVVPLVRFGDEVRY